MTLSNVSNRQLSVERIVDHAWGGVKYGIWDHRMQTWRDDIGWFLSERRAEEARAAALPGEQP